MSCTLKPFRDYDEHEVLNLFAFSGTIPVTKGHMVSIVGDGWQNAQGDDHDGHWQMLGAPGGGLAPDNTVSQRYGVFNGSTGKGSAVKIAADDATDVVGMLLYDVKEEDENGEKLIYNPRKAAEMEVALSGQAVPVLTRGIVLYDGEQLTADAPSAGVKLYVSAASGNEGELTTTDGGGSVVGIALGKKDDDGNVLVKVLL